MTSAPPTVSFEGQSFEGGEPEVARAGPGVQLPSFGTGERRSRRQQRKRQQRRRTYGAFATTVLLAGSAIALAGLAGDALWDKLDQRDDVRGTPGGADGGAAAEPVATRLVVHEDETGAVSGLTVFVPEEDRTGGTVLFVPVGSMVEVPSFGLEPVGRAQELGGLPLLQHSVENLLGMRLRDVIVVTPDAAAALVAPLGTVKVDVPERVEDVDARGRVRVLFERGAAEVGPDEVQTLLDARGQSTDLGRLVRHQAFWSAWLRAVGEAVDRDAEVDVPAAVSGLREAAVSFSAGAVRFEVVPVSALSTGGSDDGGLYQVDSEALRALLDRVAPHATVAGSEGRIKVQLLNGTGEPGVAQQVTPLLVAAGAEVKLVGNADRFDYHETQVVYYDESQRAAAEAVRSALKVGQLVFSRRGLGVVDVTVVVGTDLVGGEPLDDEA